MEFFFENLGEAAKVHFLFEGHTARNTLSTAITVTT
jgi:hypothetical protein